jgi:hypothetical protein
VQKEKRQSHFTRLYVAGALLLMLATYSWAGSIYHSPADLTLVNVNADGSAAIGADIVITGGNNGSGLYGTTDLVAIAPATGLVTFQYFFTTLDIDFETGATFDGAGFLVADVFTPFDPLFSLAPLPYSFNVSAGQSFGFRVETLDNTGEPGILTISQLSVPEAVPEPRFGVMVFLVTGVWFAFYSLRNTSKRLGEKR